jgi:hypothetical protein
MLMSTLLPTNSLSSFLRSMSYASLSSVPPVTLTGLWKRSG